MEKVSMLKLMMVFLICAFTVSFAMTIPCVNDAVYKKPDLYRVGDSDKGWKPQFDYMNWARKHKFYVGDRLYFGYDRRMYNVLQVNKTDYETCQSDHPIKNISRGAGRDVFDLTSAQSYYFLSDGSYCFQGMRVVVTVEEYFIAPAACPPANDSPSDSGMNVIISTVIDTIVVAWTLVWNV